MTAALDFSLSAELRADIGKWRFRSLLAGGAGTALCFLGFLSSPFQFYRSYLWSYMFIVGVSVGLPGVAHAAIPHRRRLGRSHTEAV